MCVRMPVFVLTARRWPLFHNSRYWRSVQGRTYYAKWWSSFPAVEIFAQCKRKQGEIKAWLSIWEQIYKKYVFCKRSHFVEDLQKFLPWNIQNCKGSSVTDQHQGRKIPYQNWLKTMLFGDWSTPGRFRKVLIKLLIFNISGEQFFLEYLVLLLSFWCDVGEGRNLETWNSTQYRDKVLAGVFQIF